MIILWGVLQKLMKVFIEMMSYGTMPLSNSVMSELAVT